MENKEHILVCLSSSPSNQKVINIASDMVKKYNAKFSALYIETSKILKKDDQQRLENNFVLAKNLGAKIDIVNGDNISNQIAIYAKKNQVTKLVVGRTGYKQNKFFSPPNFVDRLISLIPEIEIFIIPDKVQKMYLENYKNKDEGFIDYDTKDIIIFLSILFFSTLLGFFFKYIDIYDANIVLIYILAILYISYKTKSRIYSLISSFISVFLYNFFFVEPYFSTHFNNKNYALTFVTMFIVALISSSITNKMREQTREAFLKTYRTEALFDLSQKLQDCQNEKEITDSLIEQLKRILDCEINLYLDKAEDKDICFVFDNNKEINKKSSSLILPIGNSQKVYSVIEIKKKNITKFEKNLILATIRETALALEKNATRKINNELLYKNQQEKLRTTLLRTISHDLRTPLTGISGYAELLINNSDKFSKDKTVNIYKDIYEDSIWLLNLVENLLSITRFDNEHINIKKEVEYIPDIVMDAISHLGRKKEKCKIITEFTDEDLYAKVDARLIAQVVFNLVDNAIKYSDENTEIKIKVEKANEKIRISVIDEGYGITDENKTKIFDIFYTINNSSADSRRGIGLGLALCKTIIEAHSSKLEVKDNKPKGTIIFFEL